MHAIRNIAGKLFRNLKKYQLKRTKQVRFGPKTYFSRDTVFHGNNFISRGTSLQNSEIGFASYISIESTINKTKIGKYCSIGPYVKCVFGNHPTNTFVSTHPSFFSTRKQSGFSFTDKQLFEEFTSTKENGHPYSITIGNDVWIGARVTLLDGITIGDGAIVAAGSLVNKDVPPYSIYGGVPAKEIKKRFNQSQIEFLVDLKWWDKSFDWIKEHSASFQNIEQFQKIVGNEK